MFEFLEPVWGLVKSFVMFFKPILDFIIDTKVPEQIEKVDYKALFSNGWFLVPFLTAIAWNIYKQALNNLIIIVLCTGSWAFFGTSYMQEILAQDEIQLSAILPLVAGACTILGIVMYIVFFKDD